LVGDGLSQAEAADALGVSLDTIRAREHSPGRDRPSLERGLEIIRGQSRESHGVLLRRRAGRLWDAQVALPRVLDPLEEGPDPDEAFFNPLVELLDHEDRGAESGELYLKLAQEKRRELWGANAPPSDL
jgi:hypothetical protein